MGREPINAGLKKVPVARVNGAVINEYQVTVALEQMLEPYKDTKGKVRLHQPEQYAARKQVIENLIMRELLFQEAGKRGIEITDEEFQEVYKASTVGYQNEQHLKAVLVMQGLSPDEFEGQIRFDILVNKMAASVVEGKRKEITPEETRTYYDEHKAEMQGPEARRVLHVEAPLDRYAGPEQEAEARKKIEPFAGSAEAFEKAFEGDAATKAGLNIDDLGYIRRGQFHPLLDSVAFRSPEGSISRIIRTDEGLHIIMVKKILKEGTTWPFEFIKEELQKKIYEMNSVNLLNEFVDELKKTASIQVLDTVADSKLDQEKQ